MAEDGSIATGEGLPDRLLSDAEFRRVVERLLAGPSAAGSAVRVVVTSVERQAVVASYTSASLPTTEPAHAKTYFDDGQLAVTCRCDVWRTGSGTPRADADQLMQSVADLVRRHWGERDPATMLPYLKSPGIPARFTAAARAAAVTGGPVGVLHTDLDHFKKVNDSVGEPGGNAVLRQFADRLREDFGQLGVVIRTGGEEFSALLDQAGLDRYLLTASAFRRRMATEPLALIDKPNPCSIGLALLPDPEPLAGARDPDDVLSDAREAERRAKSDGRNRIALSGELPLRPAAQRVEQADLRFAALSARRLDPDDGDPKSVVSIAIREALQAAFAKGMDATAAAQEVRRELSLELGQLSSPTSRPPQLLGLLAGLEWATEVARALLGSAGSGTPAIGASDSLELVVDEAGALSIIAGTKTIDLDCAVAAPGAMRASAGRPVYEAGSAPQGAIGRSHFAKAETGCDSISPVLLLPIGDAAKNLADRLRPLAAAVVDVDDRPARGGGLPDFWQSNISRVAQACLANPNVETIIAIGDTTYAQLTLTRLHQLAQGETADLQRSLPVTSEDLNELVSRGLTIREVPANDDAALAAMEQAVVGMTPLDFERRPVIDLVRRSQRRLPMGKPNDAYRLDTIDGLRTRTFADVYPEALQLIRGADPALDHEEPRRGTFREITGFKVVLTEPLKEKVADYWKPDESSLKEYYERSFEDADGLFGKPLQSAAFGSTLAMEDFAVQAVAEATASKIPTRRINLPVTPDALDQPLGLNCIQLMPRERNGAPVLDAIFVWRTVDALVGFPFSAYGSIRWTEDFLAKVNKRIGIEDGVPPVRAGTLTYIALSFHMYLHDGDVEIARTIVLDASV